MALSPVSCPPPSHRTWCFPPSGERQGHFSDGIPRSRPVRLTRTPSLKLTTSWLTAALVQASYRVLSSIKPSTTSPREVLGPKAMLSDPSVAWATLAQRSFAPGVAVGTEIAPRPPHRPQRAGLPHWVPTLDAERQTAHWGEYVERGQAGPTAGRAESCAPRSVVSSGYGAAALCTSAS